MFDTGQLLLEQEYAACEYCHVFYLFTHPIESVQQCPPAATLYSDNQNIEQ